MVLYECLSLGGIIVHSWSYKGSYDYKPVSQATEGSHTMGYIHVHMYMYMYMYIVEF